MSKVIPAQLLTHKALETTTLCRLLKIKCKDGTIFGMANLDIDVVYNDNSGDGGITYKSINGFTPVRLAAAAGTSVDNTDLNGILADLAALGVTEQHARSGILDFADAWCYEVNYNDLLPGRHEVKGRGNCGNVTTRGEEFTAEFRSLTQRLKQAIGAVTSITCRAKFGSKPIGTGGAQPEERYPCGKDYTWVAATITSVSGSEPDRIFTCSALAGITGKYDGGVIKVTSGDNLNCQVEVETFVTGGIITLSLPPYFAFAIGNTIDIREDCSKIHNDAVHGCARHWGAAWNLHFRGEPHIPLGQEGILGTPGAEI